MTHDETTWISGELNQVRYFISTVIRKVTTRSSWKSYYVEFL